MKMTFLEFRKVFVKHFFVTVLSVFSYLLMLLLNPSERDPQ